MIALAELDERAEDNIICGFERILIKLSSLYLNSYERPVRSFYENVF
jgi:hypothetical protein